MAKSRFESYSFVINKFYSFTIAINSSISLFKQFEDNTSSVQCYHVRYFEKVFSTLFMFLPYCMFASNILH